MLRCQSNARSQSLGKKEASQGVMWSSMKGHLTFASSVASLAIMTAHASYLKRIKWCVCVKNSGCPHLGMLRTGAIMCHQMKQKLGGVCISRQIAQVGN